MGHTWREIHPTEAEAHDKRVKRILALRKKLENMSLSEFTVDELKPLYKVMGMGHDLLDHPSDEDMNRLEQKLLKLGK